MEWFLDHSPDVVMRFDRELRHLYVTPSISRWLDLSPADFLGKTHRELGFNEQDCALREGVLVGVFDTGVPAEHEITLPTRDGQRIFNWRVIPETDHTGQVVSILSIARDITEHRMTEQDLNRLFTEMLDGFALNEMICDEQGTPVDYRFLRVNPSFERLTGLSASQVVGRRALEVLPGLEPFWIEAFGRVARTGTPEHFEHCSADLGRCYEVRAYSPQSGQFACIFLDVTERKQASEALRQSREKFETLFREQADAAIIHDMSARVIAVNPAACAQYGYDEAAFLKLSVADIDTPEEAVHIPARFAALERDGRASFETVHRDAKGRRLHVDVRSSKILYGGIPCMMSICRDISERERAEEALRVSEEKFSKAFYSSPMLMTLSELDSGRYVEVNDTFCRVSGFSREEVQGKTSLELGWLDHITRQQMVTTLHGSGRVVGLELSLTGKAGNAVWCRYSGERISTRGGDYLLSIAEDITDYRQLQERNLQAGRLAALGEMATGVAHEINNPITGIVNCAQLIKDRLPPDHGCQSIADRVLREGTRVASIVRAVLAIAQPGRGEKTVARVEDFLQVVIRLFNEWFVKDFIDFRLDVAKPMPRVFVEVTQVEQLLVNLLNNACHALNEKYPGNHPDKILMLGVRPILREDGSWLQIEIYDQGPGITPAHLPRLFDPFFTTKPASVGTGLGLGLCRSIAKSHGGEIRVASEHGLYTRVTVELPVIIIEDGGEDHATETSGR